MGCVISYLKTYTKKEYKFTRRDLHIDIPLACSGEYITTLCRGDYDGSPSRLMYENESIKTVYPSNAIGIKKFKNELAAYKLLKKEDFIQNIYDIDYDDCSFCAYMTHVPKFNVNLINRVNEIKNILENKYGLIALEEYNIYNDISVNGSLLYLNRLGEMPIKHRINGSWIYKPVKKCC